MKENGLNIVYDIKEDIRYSETFWKAGDYPLHYHDFIELELVIDGSGFQIFDDEEFSLKKQDLYLVRPSDYHMVHSDNISIRNITFNQNILPKWILQKLHSLKNPVVFHLNDEEYKKFNQLFDLLINENQFVNNEINVRNNVIEIIFANFIRLSGENIALYGDNITSKIAYYIRKNNRFTQKISLSDIANYVGYSKFYISSVFHKQYGITIQEFIISQRIEYAKKLILETDLPISDIVIECGFVSSSNFYSKFIEHVGCSPLKFKKEKKINK